jgi:signal transduction histidine kinase
MNIMSNAIKFSRRETEIDFRVELTDLDSENCRLRIMIKDRGIGIPENEQT